MPNNSIGDQSIRRTIRLLKAVAERREIGWRLKDLAAQCGLTQPTAHRIINALEDERLIRQRTNDKRYIPGALLFELSLAIPAYSEFKTAARRDLKRVARNMRVMVFLWLRAEHEVVCIDRIMPSGAQTITLVGRRRPMTLSTFGIGLWLTLSKAEQDLIARKCEDGPWSSSHSKQTWENVIRRSKKYGFGFSKEELIAQRGCIALPIRDKIETPIGVLGVVAEAERFSDENVGVMVEELRDEIRAIEHQHEQLLLDIAHYGASIRTEMA